VCVWTVEVTISRHSIMPLRCGVMPNFRKAPMGSDDPDSARGYVDSTRVRGPRDRPGIGHEVMCEKQRTSTLLPPPQREETEFYPLCQLRP